MVDGGGGLLNRNLYHWFMIQVFGLGGNYSDYYSCWLWIVVLKSLPLQLLSPNLGVAAR